MRSGVCRRRSRASKGSTSRRSRKESLFSNSLNILSLGPLGRRLKHSPGITDVYRMDDRQPEATAPSRVTQMLEMGTNKPGESARRMAKQLRSDEPVRLALARLFGVKTNERAWRQGAIGEEEVARRLRRLPPTWTTLHDLPLGQNGANLDHLVIGPGGVFSLNTKNLRGRVWVAKRALLVNGHKTDYLWKSKAEAERVASILTKGTGDTISVEPILVVMGAELKIKTQSHAVMVVTRKRIKSWLEGRPRAAVGLRDKQDRKCGPAARNMDCRPRRSCSSVEGDSHHPRSPATHHICSAKTTPTSCRADFTGGHA